MTIFYTGSPIVPSKEAKKISIIAKRVPKRIRDLNHETKALLLKVARMIQVEIEHRNAPQAQPSQYGSEEMQSLILAKLTAPQAQPSQYGSEEMQSLILAKLTAPQPA